jgi:pantoate--beta-alanine ligase
MEEGERESTKIIGVMRQELAEEPLASADYVEIVDADSFEPIMRLTRPCLVLLAARFGATRLIDNMQVEIAESRAGAASGVICSL